MFHIVRLLISGSGVWAEVGEICLYLAAIWLIQAISGWWVVS